MKKIICLSILLILVCTVIFSQEEQEFDYSVSWFEISTERKAGLVQGFGYGLAFATTMTLDLSIDFYSNSESQLTVAFIYKNLFEAFISEETEYWVSALDTFYLKKSNKYISFIKALSSLLAQNMND